MKDAIGLKKRCLFFVFCACVAASAYAIDKEPIDNFYVYETAHYTVRTNTNSGTARHIGELMEKALGEYRRVTGYYAEGLPRFIINIYATKEEYDAVAKKQGFPGDITNGFYTPVPPAAIHLPYVTDQGRTPVAALLHEGTHQFIAQVINIAVPATARNIMQSSQSRLTSVPLWLNEGLATYMEGAATDDGGFEAGRVNGPRLRHLKRLIRSDEYPSLQEIMSRRYGEQFSVEDYAVAWGVVYILTREAGSPDRVSGLERLKLYLKACGQGFDTDQIESSPVLFQRIIAGEGQTLKEWERRWAESISRLK